MSQILGEEPIGKVLMHYGRLGMRWGVRRSPQQLASDKVGENTAADPDAIKAVTTQAKIKAAGSLNVVSSKDLQDLVKRMELEQKYVKATLEVAPATKKGENFIQKLVKNETESYFLKGKKGPLVSIVSDLMKDGKDAGKDTQAKVKTAATVAAKNGVKFATVVRNPKAKKTKTPKNPPVYTVTTLARR